MTRLFLRSTTSGLPSGTLPSSEQSTLTVDTGCYFEGSDSTNRRMQRFIGSAQTTLAIATQATVSSKTYYVSRWISDPITQTSIAANTWTVGMGGSRTNTNANFPITNGTVAYGMWVNVYVWKPSNGTKYGTIYDGVLGTSGSGGTTCLYVKTFSGSAVSSLTSGDAVIVIEILYQKAQSAATSYTDTFFYEGTAIPLADASSASNVASYLYTPESISFSDGYAEVKLYLHNTTSGLPSGTLPSAEQSTNTVTAACNFEGSQTTNRLMNTTIGVSQASLALATPASVSASTFYVSRWVSPNLSQTSVTAGTWTYNFAAAESNTSANFPVTSSNKAVWVNCYVWKPSNGTKYGTILDGNTAATVTEGTAAQERSQQADFTGAAVSSLTSGDACIVFEVWFAITQGAATSYTDTFYYDGTTETAGGSTVSNHASYIMTNGMDLSFGGAPTNFNRPLTAETISISESVTEIYGANRAPTAETVTIGEAIARQFIGTRALSAETITVTGGTLARIYNAMRAPTAETNTIGESLVRLFGANRALSTETTAISESLVRLLSLVRALSDTTAVSESLVRILGMTKSLTDTTVISESLARLYAANRALSAETTAISEAITKVQVLVRSLSDTTAISESIAKILGKIKALSDTTAISESIARVFVGVRALAAETNTIGESLARLKAATRALSTETVTISESLSRILGAVRSLSDTTIIGESLARIYNAIRALSDTSTISESLAKVQTLVRSLADTTIISETLVRVYNGIRALATEISTIGESLTKVHTPAGGAFFDRPLAAQTVAISESVVRAITNVRTLSQTAAISESLNRLIVVVRSLSDTTAISETLSRALGAIRSLTDTTAVSESLSRVLGIVRSLSQSTTINESLTTVKALTKSLVETVIISETLSRLATLTRILSTQITVITESLTGFFATGAQIRALVETVIISEVLARTQTLTRALTENTIITDILDALKAIIIPLWQRPTGVRRPEGIGPRNRSMERESESYFRKQFSRLTGRRYGVSKRSGFG